jgi:hypothetical protein
MLKKTVSKNKIVAGMYRYCVACFLAALSLMFIALPMLEHLANGERIAAGLLTIVLLFAVMAVGDSRRTFIWAIVLVMPALAARWINHLRPDVMPSEISIISGLIFIAFVIVHLFGFIFRSPHVDSEVLCAAVATYLMIGLLWSFVYMLIADLVQDAFVFTAGPSHVMKGFNAIYFSFVTLCTVGYGDIVPVSGMARAMAMMEATVGVFYIATVISRLVAIYSSKEQAMARGPER